MGAHGHCRSCDHRHGHIIIRLSCVSTSSGSDAAFSGMHFLATLFRIAASTPTPKLLAPFWLDLSIFAFI